jgi:hypothetical protein
MISKNYSLELIPKSGLTKNDMLNMHMAPTTTQLTWVPPSAVGIATLVAPIAPVIDVMVIPAWNRMEWDGQR